MVVILILNLQLFFIMQKIEMLHRIIFSQYEKHNFTMRK